MEEKSKYLKSNKSTGRAGELIKNWIDLDVIDILWYFSFM